MKKIVRVLAVAGTLAVGGCSPEAFAVGDGTYVVGTGMHEGSWQSEEHTLAEGSECSWSVTHRNGRAGDSGKIQGPDVALPNHYWTVVLVDGDTFSTQGCGTWHLIR